MPINRLLNNRFNDKDIHYVNILKFNSFANLKLVFLSSSKKKIIKDSFFPLLLLSFVQCI